MELGNTIRKLRKQHGWNQDEFAEKAFVSRQTVSNWENEKSYPDVHSLLILSDIFKVSVDELLKGDVEIMKKQIHKADIGEMNKWGGIFSVMLLIAFIIPYPLIKFGGVLGTVILFLYFTVVMISALKVESLKKKNNVQTYRELTAFLEGKSLDEIEQAREEAKRPYQKILLAIGSALLSMVIFLLFYLILGK
ncbi:MAG: helix-turn-helix transcriptional regulator [Ruminococcus sp.]|nr:helix-turn-helix transcriptional regulator [Ruminococcus sp.]